MTSEEESEIVILHHSEIPSDQETGTEYSAQFQSELKGFKKLEKAWPEVMKRLQSLVEKESNPQSGNFRVSTIEVGVKISAGFDFMLKGTADADVKIIFSRSENGSG